MKKYVKKPIPIHAFRWNGDPITLGDELDGIQMELNNFVFKGRDLFIKSLEGTEKCPVGDYIIRGIHGEYYPCDPKIFKESYKRVK